MTLERTARGDWAEVQAFTHCANGHRLRPPTMQRAYLPCGCAGTGGHALYRCWTCGDVQYDPPHDLGTDPGGYPDMGALRGRST